MIKKTLRIICGEIFQTALIGYLLLLLAEALQAGSVSYFFNLNILLIITLISGLLVFLFDSA